MYVIPIGAFGHGTYASKYRLMDIDTMQIMDVEAHKVKKALKNNLISIQGMELENGEIIKSSNLALLARLDEDRDKVRVYSYTIMYRLNNVRGYMVTDCNGRVSCLTTEEVLDTYLTYGISNCITMTTGNQIYIIPMCGTFPEFKVDEKTSQILNEKSLQNKEINAKISLMNYPYIIVGKTVKITDTRIRDINIVKPVEHIYDSVFDNCNVLEEIILPPTLKQLDINIIGKCKMIRSLSVSRKTELLNYHYDYTLYRKIINYYD